MNRTFSAVTASALCMLLGSPVLPGIGAVLAAPLCADLDPEPDFTGTFRDGNVSLELVRSDTGFSGTLRVGEQSYPVAATAEGSDLRGTFDADGSMFEFTAKLEEDVLTLNSDGTKYELKRKRAANPLAKPEKAEKNPLVKPKESGSAKEGQPPDPDLPQRLQHPLGVTVSVPEGWQSQQNAGTLVLVPKDAPRDESGPNEVYLLVYSVAEAASAQDATLLDKLTDALRQLGPSFKPNGKPELFECPAGPAARLRFTAKGDDGTPIAANLDVVTRDGVAIGLLGLGERGAVSRREDLARKIFNGFRFGEPQRDPDVAGTWSRSDSYADPAAGFSMATSVTLTLGEDGRFSRRSQVAGGNADVGAESSGPATGGRWFAGNGAFVLLTDSGETVNGSYSLQGGRLVVTDAEGRRQIWSR